MLKAYSIKTPIIIDLLGKRPFSLITDITYNFVKSKDIAKSLMLPP